jgi:putative membrane protein
VITTNVCPRLRLSLDLLGAATIQDASRANRSIHPWPLGRREVVSLAMHSLHPRLPVGVPVQQNRFLQGLLLVYAVFWGLMAISPASRQTWLLENLLVFGLVGVLAATHRRFVFSNVSYSLIFAFLMLHAVGSHYTYSDVPLGQWSQELLGHDRNHYDRFVHFAYGLLFGYPLREMTLRVTHVHGGWSFVIPVLAILATSSFYEILESWAARIVDPELGHSFVGAQGDIWDGQKDMTLAIVGTLLALAVGEWIRRRRGHEAYVGPES